MTDESQEDAERDAGNSNSREGNLPTPVYEKPILRKYDQIEQVKPYGPSELEAG